jgi:hypothetical protein
MLAGAQKILNARPLTPIRANPQDCDAITPSSLIHHHSTKPMNPIGALPTRDSLLMNHRHVQERVNEFWAKWMLLYTQYLQKRHTREKKERNLVVGDLVLMVDKPTPRGQYPLARVVKVFPDALGCVRSVQVMTANANKLHPDLPCCRKVYERDTTKLALLEFPVTNPESESIHRYDEPEEYLTRDVQLTDKEVVEEEDQQVLHISNTKQRIQKQAEATLQEIMGNIQLSEKNIGNRDERCIADEKTLTQLEEQLTQEFREDLLRLALHDIENATLESA